MNFLAEIEALLKGTGVLDATSIKAIAASFREQRLARGNHLAHQGEPDGNEYFLLEGRAQSSVTDAEGRAATIGLYIGPAVISPNIARTSQGSLLVDIELLDDARVGVISADRLSELMVASPLIREWGNGIMRDELTRKVGREWCLAALSAADRFAWFREHFAGYEDRFPHTLIASFLGMTPVTLSRLRNS